MAIQILALMLILILTSINCTGIFILLRKLQGSKLRDNMNFLGVTILATSVINFLLIKLELYLLLFLLRLI